MKSYSHHLAFQTPPDHVNGATARIEWRSWLRSSTFLILGFLMLAPKPIRAEDMTASQIDQFQKVIRDYLRQHPEVIIDVLKSYQDKHSAELAAQALIASLSDNLFYDKTSPVGGNPDGDVTIVEIFDYGCTYCKAVAPDFSKVIATDGKVRLIYKEFPILGPASVTAAKAALAAAQQGKYIAFHDKLLAYKGDLDDAAVFAIAHDVGLDVARLKVDMEGQQVNDQILLNYWLADKLNIQEAHAFVIGRELLLGAPSVEELAAAIKRARAGR